MSATSPHAAVDLRGRSPWIVIPPLCLGFFMIMIDTTIVNIAVPTLVEAFDASLTEVGWVNSSYLLTFAVLLLVTGRLGDRFEARRVFVVGLVVFTLASAWCGMASTIEWLIVARAVQGVGGALMTPQTMAIVTRVFPPRRRGAAMGVWGSVAGVATITGPLLGGLLVETVGWEWIFFVNVPVGVIALVLALWWLPALPTHQRTFDVLGMVASVVGLFLLVFGLQEGSTYDWGTIAGPITVWGVIAAGVVVLVWFGWLQLRRGEEALLPMRLFRQRNFLLANVAGAAVGFSLTGLFFPLTVFLQAVVGLSPIRAALVGVGGSVLSGVVAPFAGRLSDRVPAKWVVAFGFAMFAVSIGWVALWIDAEASPWRLLVPMTVLGLGTGSVFSPLANLAASALDSRTAGAGAGVFNTNRQVGGVIGAAATIALLTSQLGRAIPARAAELATALPEQFLAPFVDGLSQASVADFSSGGSGEIPLPPGVPADVATQIRELALRAVHEGFGDAVRDTLLLAVAAFVVGLVATLAMHATRPHAQEAVDEPAASLAGPET